MKKSVKGLFAASVIAAAIAAPAQAEVSMNIGATSNYIWRGVTQTSDASAVSGGVDYSHDAGIYVGTWASNITGGYELDLYAGYAGEMSGIGYDVGYISYGYPNDTTLDFSEVYLGVSYDMFSAMVSYDSDNSNMYAEVGAEFALPEDLTLGLHAGSYNFDIGTDYTDYSVSLSKGDVSFTISDTSENLAWGMTDNYRVVASWGQSF